MSSNKTNQSLCHNITTKVFASMISESLRYEYKNDGSAIKRISLATDISTGTISKWYQSKNTPESKHLLRLAAVYPSVLKVFLVLSGYSDVWDLYCNLNSDKTLIKEKPFTRSINDSSKDKFVTINITIAKEHVIKLNNRQIWFYGELQQNKKLSLTDLALFWGISKRTARRDISTLIDLELLYHYKYNNHNYYMTK